jgi:hypothetical protein
VDYAVIKLGRHHADIPDLLQSQQRDRDGRVYSASIWRS